MRITRWEVGMRSALHSSGVLLRRLREQEGALHALGLLQRPASQGHRDDDLEVLAVSFLPPRFALLLRLIGRESIRM